MLAYNNNVDDDDDPKDERNAKKYLVIVFWFIIVVVACACACIRSLDIVAKEKWVKIVAIVVCRILASAFAFSFVTLPLKLALKESPLVCLWGHKKYCRSNEALRRKGKWFPGAI